MLILLLIVLLYVLSTMCRRGHKGLSALYGWNYAHRGLHGDGVPENSLEAFRRAAEAGYGSELDVHLTADGQLAVIHDSFLKRTTGADGRVEDLTAAQLSEHYLQGTSETIPLFTQVLDIYAGKAPLIVEIKPVSNNIDALCQKVCEVLDSYTGVYCVESFDPRCVYWFTKNRPDMIRGQLTENLFLKPDSPVPFVVKFMLKEQMFNIFTRPDFVAYRFSDRKTISNFICRKLWGAPGVAWTVKTAQEYETALTENWIPIFEDIRP